MQGSDANLSAFAKDNCDSWVKDALKQANLVLLEQLVGNLRNLKEKIGMFPRLTFFL